VWLPAALGTVVLVAWELGVRAGAIRPLFFTAPTTIASAIAASVASGVLLEHAWATLRRTALGLLLGGGGGIALGLAMGWSGALRRAADPLVAAAHALPKIAVLPLILIFFGIGEAPKIVIATMGAFFPLLINTMDGVRQINPVYYEVARNYGAGRLALFTRVMLPGSLPFVLSGARLALNAALLLTVAVEMISARAGLGVMIWRAWETMRVEQLYASLAVIVLLGVGSNLALGYLARRLAPWQQHREG
jgi:NitT/TauT family transport system permease protein